MDAAGRANTVILARFMGSVVDRGRTLGFGHPRMPARLFGYQRSFGRDRRRARYGRSPRGIELARLVMNSSLVAKPR